VNDMKDIYEPLSEQQEIETFRFSFPTKHLLWCIELCESFHSFTPTLWSKDNDRLELYSANKENETSYDIFLTTTFGYISKTDKEATTITNYDLYDCLLYKTIRAINKRLNYKETGSIIDLLGSAVVLYLSYHQEKVVTHSGDTDKAVRLAIEEMISWCYEEHLVD